MHSVFGERSASLRTVRATRFAFTLIELLVVIAIIAILAAILFPVFARARENARRSSCQSNLKQIGLGIFQYTQDYDEKYPMNNSDFGGDYAAVNDYSQPTSKQNWIRDTQPYLKSWQIFVCPSSVPETSPADWAPSGNSNTSYATNAVVIRDANAGGSGLAQAAISSSATLILMGENTRSYQKAFSRPVQKTATTFNTIFGAPLHFNGNNYLFADGHVKWRRTSSVTAREYGLSDDTTLSETSPLTAGYNLDTMQVSG